MSRVEPSSRVGVTLDLILKTLIASSDFSNLPSKNWEGISRLIPGTTAIQCARRYEELLSGGGGIAIQHVSKTLNSSVFDVNGSNLTEPEGVGKLGSINSRPGSSKNRGGKDEKDKSMGIKDVAQRRDLSQRGPTMVIHVCDEAKNLKKDFHCPRDLLVQEMKYFAEYLSMDAQRWEEVDISVHCDVQIFDWLIKYVKRGTKEISDEPKLEANNVVSILISSEFLKMDSLVTECISFCHKNMSTIVATPCNMGCINDRLLTRIADLFTHNEADDVRDRKDKFKSKLFSKKLEKLFEPEGLNPDSPEKAASLFRCSICKRILTNALRTKVKCMQSRMTVDRNGRLMYAHVPDKTFDVNDFILELKSQLKTWRDVYWRIWATINFLSCNRCNDVFQLTEFGHCSYHPEPARYEMEDSCQGLHPCCHQKILRFDPALISKGCRVKDHIVTLAEGSEGDGGGNKTPKSVSQRLYEDLLARKDAICVPYQRLSDASSDREMEVNVFANEVFACHTHTSGIQLPSLSGAGPDEGKIDTKPQPRLQALTMQKEVSYYLDDFGFGESDDEVGDEESQKGSMSSGAGKKIGKGMKRSRVTVEPQAILLGAPGFEQTKKSTWDTQRSMRYNQDAQRQEDARRMRDIQLFLTKLRLAADKVEKPKREFAGGIFSRLDAQWKAVHQQGKSSQQSQFRNKPKPFGQVRSSLA